MLYFVYTNFILSIMWVALATTVFWTSYLLYSTKIPHKIAPQWTYDHNCDILKPKFLKLLFNGKWKSIAKIVYNNYQNNKYKLTFLYYVIFYRNEVIIFIINKYNYKMSATSLSSHKWWGQVYRMSISARHH